MRNVLRNRKVLLGGAVLLAFVLTAVFANVVAPYDPIRDTDYPGALRPPSAEHWFGTDEYGRDVFSRVVFAARVTIYISLTSVAIAAVFGTALGNIAGYFGGRIDSVLVMVIDALLAFPTVILAIGIVAVAGSGINHLILALGVGYTPRFARIVRANVVSLREQPFIEAARSLGNGSLRIIVRHITPNNMAPLLVQGTVYFAYAILAEAALSYLGLGVQDPNPSWGNILFAGRSYMQFAWWLSVFPGVAISLAVLSVNILGDGLRDVLDPRLDTR